MRAVQKLCAVVRRRVARDWEGGWGMDRVDIVVFCWASTLGWDGD
jgi:hypothetical protein